MQETLRDAGLIPGLGRSPGRGHGNPLQYSCLENPHGQGSLTGCSPCGSKESDMTEVTKHTLTHDNGKLKIVNALKSRIQNKPGIRRDYFIT